MKKIEKETKKEPEETEELCCSDSNACSLDRRPQSKKSNRGNSARCSGSLSSRKILVESDENIVGSKWL